MPAKVNLASPSRRQFLIGAAGVAGGAFLAGCSSDGRGSTPTNSGGGGGTGWLPSYVAPPEIPGAMVSSNPLVPIAYEKYPHPPVKTVQEVPGSGGTVTSFQLMYGAPPAGLDSNEWWKQLNGKLGVDWQPTLVAAASYADKLATTLAGGDLPDLMYIRPDVNPPAAQAVQQGAFTDLTDALSGDAVKAYPNIAAIPTYVWERSAMNGRIFGVPRPVYPLNKVTTLRADWAADLGYPDPPTNAEEVLEIWTAFAQSKTPDGQDRWAIGGLDDTVTEFAMMMFRAPNKWQVNDDGTVTNVVETDEFEASIQFLRDAWEAGVFHPDALVLANSPDDQNNYVTGRTGFKRWSPAGWFWTGGPVDLLADAEPDADVLLMDTPGHDGGESIVHEQTGWWGMAAIPATVGKDDARVEELLGVLDYWSAPFGSEEYLFLTSGIEGRHFSYDADNQPVASEDQAIQGEKSGNYFIEHGETVLFFPGTDGRATATQASMESELSHSEANPTNGLVSESFMRNDPTLYELNKSFANDIISGRKTMSDLQEWRERWRNEGGDEVRSEFEAAIAERDG